jgi:cytochrome oxidase complex assembly protein 1
MVVRRQLQRRAPARRGVKGHQQVLSQTQRRSRRRHRSGSTHLRLVGSGAHALPKLPSHGRRLANQLSVVRRANAPGSRRRRGSPADPPAVAADAARRKRTHRSRHGLQRHGEASTPIVLGDSPHARSPRERIRDHPTAVATLGEEIRVGWTVTGSADDDETGWHEFQISAPVSGTKRTGMVAARAGRGTRGPWAYTALTLLTNGAERIDLLEVPRADSAAPPGGRRLYLVPVGDVARVSSKSWLTTTGPGSGCTSMCCRSFPWPHRCGTTAAAS